MQPEVKKQSFIKDVVVFTLIALAIVIPLRMFVAQPFIVSGHSMDNTFADHQYLIVDQLTYHFHDPKREDVVIFRYPNNPSIFFIKRVIGLPGETISANNGKLTIVNAEHPEGMILPDPHILDPQAMVSTFSTTLGPTEYWVMGDNRGESSDSRVWGPLERKFIVGRPFLRLFPLTKISLFPGI